MLYRLLLLLKVEQAFLRDFVCVLYDPKHGLQLAVYAPTNLHDAWAVYLVLQPQEVVPGLLLLLVDIHGLAKSVTIHIVGIRNLYTHSRS